MIANCADLGAYMGDRAGVKLLELLCGEEPAWGSLLAAGGEPRPWAAVAAAS